MQMISFVFMGLVAGVFIAIYICNRVVKDEQKRNSIVNWILLISSYICVAYADIRFAIILAVLSISTWFFSKRKRLISVGVLIALIALGYFKYTNFFVESFTKLIGKEFIEKSIVLPMGISFYVFSAIGYLLDVKRGKHEARNLKDVALYLSFFPKITSGPIQKSKLFFEQMDVKRELGWNTFCPGIQIFVFGLFKKLVLADRLSVFVNQVYETPMAFGSLTVLGAAMAYSLQIYFDFSGYSDMAIGVAKILGFDLPRNFNLPYLAHNVTEFWKRWHITLSEWLQEYLYISLGGNRKGKIRTYINLILTMVIGGIWHGASWTYIIWGFLHGIALAAHKLWMKFTHSQEKEHSPIMNVISIITTFLFTTFCWIFFRAESLTEATGIIRRIFAFETGLEQPYFWLFVAAMLLVGACVFAYMRTKKTGVQVRKKNFCKVEGYYPIRDLTKFWDLVFFFVVCGLILCWAYTGGSPFIYGKY